MGAFRWRIAVLVLAFSASARAAPIRLRMSAIAPEGTAWARELKAFARDVETETHGEVQMHWYLGGIAGSEMEAVDRIRRNQLDGAAGGLFCERLAPSLEVERVLGLARSRDEAKYLITRLRPIVDPELARSGFVDLGLALFGPVMLFTRHPVHTLDELARERIWLWTLDELNIRIFREMGLRFVIRNVEDAARAFDHDELDGFLSIPTGALAYQWSTRARYFLDLRTGFLPGCVVMAQRAWDGLTMDQRAVVQAAATKFVIRFDELGRSQDDLLLGRLFDKQGLHKLAVSPRFRARFFDAAQAARDKVATKLIPAALLEKVGRWLAEYRQGRSPAAKR